MEEAFGHAAHHMARGLPLEAQAQLLRALLDAGARDFARPEDLALVSKLQRQMTTRHVAAEEELALLRRREQAASEKERDAVAREEALHDQVDALKAQVRPSAPSPCTRPASPAPPFVRSEHAAVVSSRLP